MEGLRRIFDIESRLRKLGYQGFECEGFSLPSVSARVPQAVIDAGVAVFDIGGVEFKNGESVWLSPWTAIYADRQFYVSPPDSFSASSKQSLVSVLSIAESFGCSCAWVVVDRNRQDFIKMVSVLKYLGFRLSQTCIEDSRLNTSFALLRYELV